MTKLDNVVIRNEVNILIQLHFKSEYVLGIAFCCCYWWQTCNCNTILNIPLQVPIQIFLLLRLENKIKEECVRCWLQCFNYNVKGCFERFVFKLHVMREQFLYFYCFLLYMQPLIQNIRVSVAIFYIWII